MTADELLHRIAQTLKSEVGPEVQAAYPRTQAFLAAAVLERLARQLQLAEGHAAAEAAEMALLAADLDAISRQSVLPQPVQTAISRVCARHNAAALGDLIKALYAERVALGTERFDTLLGRVRSTLRAGINREAEYSS